MGQSRRTFTDEFKAAAVGRFYRPGATQGGVAKELGVTISQLKTWRLEIEAAGSKAALRRQQADAALRPAKADVRCGYERLFDA